MMFIVRGGDSAPSLASLQVKLARKTPEIVPNGAGKTDYFCVGEADAIAALREQGREVVEPRDGWYADDTGGGVAIFGHGKYWEIRETPFVVKEAVGPSAEAAQDKTAGGEMVNVRGAIFGV